MKILVLDNYDSFTYNLVHLVHELGYGKQMEIFRNDKIALEKVADYDKILLSPGPGIPLEAGIMPELIKSYGASKSILGVCLGHQALSEVYGAKLYNIPHVLHGIADLIDVIKSDEILFKNVPKHFKIGHYHSWAVHPDSVNNSVPLEVTATDQHGHIMGIRHTQYDVRGVQFHPESVLTEYGAQIMLNWLEA